MTEFARLQECRAELEGLQVTGPSDWHLLADTWANRWRPWLKQTFGSAVDDCEEKLKMPRWAFVPDERQGNPRDGLWGSYRPGGSPSEVAAANAQAAQLRAEKPQRDRERAQKQKDALLAYLDGLQMLVGKPDGSQPNNAPIKGLEDPDLEKA